MEQLTCGSTSTRTRSASDGTDTPAELVREAAAAGLDVVALTDHDAMSGWAEAQQAADEVGITLVPGLEISTKFRHRGVHLLAYLPDPTYAPLVDGARPDPRRPHRAHARDRGRRCAATASTITEDDVRREAGGSVAAGRPHVADALVRLGVASPTGPRPSPTCSTPGSPATSTATPPPLEDMIPLVVAAGGVPVIAHPWGRGGGTVLDVDALAR